jgi:hypothetical protein
VLWDLEAAFMEKKVFSKLMDEVIERKLLDGNTAQEPHKTVRIMVCADFEDSCVPEEKFFHWTPVPLDDLPPFKLCAAVYWEEQHKFAAELKGGKTVVGTTLMDINNAKNQLQKVVKK